RMVTGSYDGTLRLWDLKIGVVLKKMEGHRTHDSWIFSLDFSSDSRMLASGSSDTTTKLWDTSSWQLLETIWGGFNYSLAWTPDGTQLLLGGNGVDPTIRAWDTLTWQQVDGPWKGHFKTIHAISLNSSGTLLASASHDNCVRLWRFSDRRNIAIFKHSGELNCVTFSVGDKHILSGGVDKKISEWPISE
ncbi:WD40 repeat-like protein, partial [Suillus hirtellus]